MITHRDRITACLSNQILDHPPVSLWRHFPVDDQSPHSLARAILWHQRTFEFDMVKVTPASSYCLKDWGVRDEWRVAIEGTRDYTSRVIHNPDEWAKLPHLNPHQGYLAGELECLRKITRELADTPVIQTIFSPLSQAKNLVGPEILLVHLRNSPDALHAGLKIITESTRRFIEAIQETGVAGIFYAVQHAQYGLLSMDEYHRFGRYYDLQLLEAAKSMSIRMLHLHGQEIMFDSFIDYPINIINWHDRETSPTLQAALQKFPAAVCGGISRSTLVFGNPDQIHFEAEEAILSTAGKRLLLSTGCVVPIIAPYGNILAARQSVDKVQLS